MRKIIGLCIAVLAISGCSLGDVSEKGASCPPKNATHKATLGIIGGVDCTISSCDVNGSDYTENIQFGYCPVEFSQCGYDSGKDVYYCAKIACMEDEHIYDDACEADSVDHCGSHENDCRKRPGWGDGVCRSKECVASACSANYELQNADCVAHSMTCGTGEHFYTEGGVCEENTLEHCGSHTVDCSKLSGWNGGVCSTDGNCIATGCTSGYELREGKCEALTECPDGEHLYNGACEEDSLENCGKHDYMCAAVPGWLDGKCTMGKCFATSCTTGYELDDGGQCKALIKCPDGQHIHEGECEPDSLENCGKHENDCRAVTGWKDGECTGGACAASACVSGYKLNVDKCEALTGCPTGQHIDADGTDCEPDSLEHCGKRGNDCSKSLGWGEGECTEGVCVPSKCGEGYCLKDGGCVDGEANNNACGITGEACQTCGENTGCSKGVCEPTQCERGQHVYQSKCEPDSTANCGAHDKKCNVEHAVEQDCKDSGCVATKCMDGFHVYLVNCEADSVDHCGEHGNACALEHTKAHNCSNGECIATDCDAGYFINSKKKCQKYDINNCGGEGWLCHTGKVANSATVKCSFLGACQAATCSSGFYSWDGVCKPYDNNNCGGNGIACTTDKVPFSTVVNCSSGGVCQATLCKSGYKVSAGKCIVSGNGSCGSMFPCGTDSCCEKPNCGGFCTL